MVAMRRLSIYWFGEKRNECKTAKFQDAPEDYFNIARKAIISEMRRKNGVKTNEKRKQSVR
jgi:hypothetical protein